MITESKNIKDLDAAFMQGNIGIEKESLRISDLKLSRIPHDHVLGSALYNKYITTDFSDAQIEFINVKVSNPEKVFIFNNTSSAKNFEVRKF